MISSSDVIKEIGCGQNWFKNQRRLGTRRSLIIKPKKTEVVGNKIMHYWTQKQVDVFKFLWTFRMYRTLDLNSLYKSDEKKAYKLMNQISSVLNKE